MKITDLMKLTNKKNMIVIGKIDDTFWLSVDKPCMVRLTEREFTEFLFKFNAKYQHKIPMDIKNNTSYISKNGGEFYEGNFTGLKSIIDGEAKGVLDLTDFYLKSGKNILRIYKSSDFIGTFDSKYEFLFEEAESFYGDDNHKPIYGHDEYGLKFVLMPFWIQDIDAQIRALAA